MTDLTRRQLVVCVVAAVVVLALGLRQLGDGGGADGGGGPAVGGAVEGDPAAADGSLGAIEVEEDGGDGGEKVVVHVAGAVRRPGVYELAAGSRVDDAVGRAGGATRRADLGGLNLAAEVQDGRQVLVPRRVPAGGAGGTPAGTAGAAPAEGQPLNLNTATLEQLDTLSGIGPVTAQKIIDLREERGGFGSVEELGEIPGIGDVRLAALRAEVTL